ncbi:MAG: peptide deformylase [Verrucomicrobia bacterium]|nr:peptide deformylase [Verrucomicrobiota bacterium]
MIKNLSYFGDPILRTKCKPVEKITDEILKIAQELVDTVTAHNGSGLAAPQIGYDLRMFVVVLSDQVDKSGNPYDEEPKVFINPVITRASKEKNLKSEGCLSIPNFYEEVERPREIDVEALDINGNLFSEKKLHRWRARCIQHEMDHLDGILFIDRFSEPLKHRHNQALQLLEMRFKQARTIQGDPFKQKGLK